MMARKTLRTPFALFVANTLKLAFTKFGRRR